MLQKVIKLLKFLLCFPREANDQAGAEDGVGHQRPQPADALPDQLAAAPAVHVPQDPVVDVLDGDIKIVEHLAAGGHSLQKLVVHLVGIEIMQADPGNAGDLLQLPQQVGEPPAAVEIQPVAGDILRHHQKLPHAGLRQTPGLLHQRFHGRGTEGPADHGDDAVGAPVVAALRDAEIGGIPGRQQDSAPRQAAFLPRGKIFPPGRGVERALDGLHDAVVAAGAQGGVHLRQLPEKVALVSLGQAAGNDQRLQLALLFQLRQLQNRLNGLALGAVNKAAGIDNGRVSPLRLLQKLHARLLQEPQHLLGIHQIFGAAQR